MKTKEKLAAENPTRQRAGVPQKQIFLLSDSSGNLLEHFFHAVLTQFPKDRFHIQSLPFIKDESRLLETLKPIREGVLFHAFATDTLKSAIAKLCWERGLACWDVTGPTVDFLEVSSGIKRYAAPQPLHHLDTGYMGRMHALEFAMQHDDGRRIEELGKAEIILLGISRVSKSPVALFLAYRGFRVSNISIIPSHGLPDPLEEHAGKNVAALTIQPKKLSEIRRRRFSAWQLQSDFTYEDLRSVIREVMDAEGLYKKKGWPMIDTTGLAVEETSTLVLSTLQLKPKVFEEGSR